MSGGISALYRLVKAGERAPEVTRAHFDKRATQGETLDFSFRTRYAKLVHLLIRQKDIILYAGNIPRRGTVRVFVLTPDDVEIELTTDNKAGTIDTNRWQITPKAMPPRFAKLRVPRKIWLGETILAVWRAIRATDIEIEVETQDGTQQRIGNPNDACLIKPSKPGAVILRFFLKGQHDKHSYVRVVRVKTRKPRIDVDYHIQTGAPGERLLFTWHIKDATNAFLEHRGQRQAIGPDGQLKLALGTTTEIIRLEAHGVGGKAKKVLRAVPQLHGGLH